MNQVEACLETICLCVGVQGDIVPKYTVFFLFFSRLPTVLCCQVISPMTLQNYTIHGRII